MKYLSLIFILFLQIAPLSTQSKLLASVEVIETRIKTVPPAEKKKVIKKKRKNKRLKKRNKLADNNRDYIKIGLIFNLILFSSAFIAFLVLAIVSSLPFNIALFLLIGGLALMFALMFLVILLVYMKKKKKLK
jgi:hypothetical protein